MFVHGDGFQVNRGKVNAGSVVDKGTKKVDAVLEASKAIGKAGLLATKRVLKPTVRHACGCGCGCEWVGGWVGGWVEKRFCEDGHQDSLGSTSSNDLNVFGKKKTRKKVLKVSSEELAARLRLSCLLGFNI